MKKNIIFSTVIIFLFFLSLSAVSAQNRGYPDLPTQVGVTVGQKFFYKITDDSLFSENSPLTQFSLSELIGNNTDFNQTQFELMTNVSLDTFTINTTKIPKSGDVITVKVLELPSTTANGTIVVTHGNETKEIESFFMFGTPITTTNWTFWKEELNQIDAINNNVADITLLTTISSGSTTFNLSTTVYINNPPDVLTDSGISNLQLKVTTSYNKSSGVQLFMDIELSGKVKISNYPSTNVKYGYSWELSPEEDKSQTSTPSSNSSPASSPGFEFITMAFGLLGIVFVYKRKQY